MYFRPFGVGQRGGEGVGFLVQREAGTDGGREGLGGHVDAGDHDGSRGFVGVVFNIVVIPVYHGVAFVSKSEGAFLKGAFELHGRFICVSLVNVEADAGTVVHHFIAGPGGAVEVHADSGDNIVVGVVVGVFLVLFAGGEQHGTGEQCQTHQFECVFHLF